MISPLVSCQVPPWPRIRPSLQVRALHLPTEGGTTVASGHQGHGEAASAVFVSMAFTWFVAWIYHDQLCGLAFHSSTWSIISIPEKCSAPGGVSQAALGLCVCSICPLSLCALLSVPSDRLLGQDAEKHPSKLNLVPTFSSCATLSKLASFSVAHFLI